MARRSRPAGLRAAHHRGRLPPGPISATLPLAGTGFAASFFAQAANHRIQLGSDPPVPGSGHEPGHLLLQGSTPFGRCWSAG
ncbi:hypothetical protein ACH44C_00950 [Streptomyces purpureus]|uniref:hypothetical protein n=1 Tax=Streptomyces purpureus TaxID=1951 RepID=UPI0037AA3067